MAKKTKFDIDKCIERRLLVRIPASKSKADKSSILSSYLAMFHAARAFLFLNGYRDKSHFAVARFLEDKYVNSKCLEKQWVELLDYYRDVRHDNQYGINSLVSEDDAAKAFRSASDFVDRMKTLLADIKSKVS